MDSPPSNMTSSAQYPNQAVTLLLVDDHAVVREGLRAMLENEHAFKVIGEAKNGAEAVQLCQELKPRIVLMDIRMPLMDGLEATKRIKYEHPQITVIILTMYENEGYVLRGIQAGASGYLLKDAPRQQVVDTIMAASAGEVLISGDLLRGTIERLLNPKATQLEMLIDTEFEVEALTKREAEALVLVSRGMTNREIALELGIGLETVKKLVQSLIAKLGASDRTHAVVKAMRLGLLT